jgi:ABC-type transport system involved in multi-copper enzyme maturation permease subunit
MFSIAWITLLRITERAILIQFGVLALVLAYVALGLDTIVLNDAAGTEQSGVMVAWLFLMAFTLFWTTIEIPREVNRKEVQIYLSKPVTRLSYLLGKSLGMAGMTLGGEIILMGVFSLCLLIKGQHPSAWLAFACGRMALFLVLLNALCCCASIAVGEVPGMVLVATICIIGLAVCALPVIAWAGFYPPKSMLIEGLHYLVPDLLHYRWEPKEGARLMTLLHLAIYTAGWSIILLVAAREIMVRKDLS